MMLAMMLATLMTYAQPAELLARYPLDETEGTVVMDASGNGFDATLNECNSCWVEGTIEGALAFDGFNGVTLPADVMGLTNDNGSVAFWVNSGEPSTIYTMFWAGDNTTGGGFGPENEMHVHLEQAATDIWAGGEVSWVVQLGNESGQKFLYSDPWKGWPAATPPSGDVVTVKDGEWHHVAVTWGEGLVKLYVDGVNLHGDTADYAPNAPYDLTNMFLGQMGGGGRRLVGMMDEVRIYEGVLIDSEVETLFNKDFTRLNEQVAEGNGLSVYPNPVAKESTISFKAEAGLGVSVNVYSVTGARISNVYSGITVPGLNRIQLNAEHFRSGLYLVEVQVGNEVSHAKFMVK